MDRMGRVKTKGFCCPQYERREEYVEELTQSKALVKPARSSGSTTGLAMAAVDAPMTQPKNPPTEAPIAPERPSMTAPLAPCIARVIAYLTPEAVIEFVGVNSRSRYD